MKIHRWTIIAALSLGLAACGSESPDPVPVAKPADTPAAAARAAAATATPDPKAEARASARKLAQRGDYTAASRVYEHAGMHAAATRVRRSGAHTLTAAALHALGQGRYKTAQRLATQSRRLRRTAAAAGVIASASAALERQREAARIARDQRTCSSDEQRTVRDTGAVPPGCEDYAAEQAPQAEESSNCDPSYSGACLDPNSADYDCEGGSGNGPDYTGPVDVVGDDHYGLDADGDGVGCENS